MVPPYAKILMGTLKEKLLKDYDKKSFIIWIATIS